MKQTIDKKRVGIIILVVLLYLASIGLLAAGVALMATNHEQFSMYNLLVKTWNENSGVGSPGFNKYLQDYNTLAASNSATWVKAEYSLFATGISLTILSILFFVLTIWINVKKLKNTNIEKKQKIKKEKVVLNKK